MSVGECAWAVGSKQRYEARAASLGPENNRALRSPSKALATRNASFQRHNICDFIERRSKPKHNLSIPDLDGRVHSVVEQRFHHRATVEGLAECHLFQRLTCGNGVYTRWLAQGKQDTRSAFTSEKPF